MSEWFIGAVGFALVLEGLLPMLSPKGWRRAFEAALQLRDGQIRFLGLIGVVTGALLLVLMSS